MRIILTLVLGLGLTTAASAAPAVPQPSLMPDSLASAVDWHPSRSHWDHHYHSHQSSMHDRELTELERRIQRSVRGHDPRWSGYAVRPGRRLHRR